MSDGANIAAGGRVEAFLADDAVAGALVKMEQEYVRAWRAATTVEEREAEHAKMRVLDDFRLELRTIVDRGKMSAATVARAERVAQSNQRSR